MADAAPHAEEEGVARLPNGTLVWYRDENFDCLRPARIRNKREREQCYNAYAYGLGLINLAYDTPVTLYDDARLDVDELWAMLEKADGTSGADYPNLRKRAEGYGTRLPGPEPEITPPAARRASLAKRAHEGKTSPAKRVHQENTTPAARRRTESRLDDRVARLNSLARVARATEDAILAYFPDAAPARGAGQFVLPPAGASYELANFNAALFSLRPWALPENERERTEKITEAVMEETRRVAEYLRASVDAVVAAL
jgi:hypothetical protein